VNGSVIAMTRKGKSFRKRQWWLTGDDELAAYDRKVEVWISSRHSIPKNLFDDLESMLKSSSAKDVPPAQWSRGGQGYILGRYGGGPNEHPPLPGPDIRNGRLAREGQHGSFYRHESKTGGFCKLGRDDEGLSSKRAEHAAACIALEDAITFAESKRPLILLTDSKYLLMAIQKWIGEEINPTIKESPDGDILQEILELFRARIDLGLFTLFVKIKSHRGEFFNEMVDRWADKGRHTEMGARWTSLRQRPIFTWTASGVAHCSIMSKLV